jgi:hypothetical protein
MTSLKSVIIGMLYDNNGLKIKERHLKEKCSDIQPKEIAACLLICNLLMPYIPDKKVQYLIPYQIPFVLMANEILRCTGYAKFMVKLVPLTKPSHINTLKIDAPSLFMIFCSGKKEKLLDMYDYNDQAILSQAVATQNKAAVFGSIFNLDAINKCTDSYGLDFADYVYLSPGGKDAYLMGTKKNPLPQHTCPVPKKEKSKTKASAKKEGNATEKDDKAKQDRTRRLAALKTEISALERKLKGAYKQRNAFLLDNGIKDPKKKKKMEGKLRKTPTSRQHQ